MLVSTMLKANADVKLASKILCIVSGVIALSLLLVASVYIAWLDAPRSACNNDSNTKDNYALAKASSSLAIVASFMQVIWAVLLLLRWMEDTTKYFIGHIIFGAVTFVAILLIAVYGGIQYCTKCEAFLAFLVIDTIFCIMSAIVLCCRFEPSNSRQDVEN